MTLKEIWELIRCCHQNLDPIDSHLLLAIISVESSGKPEVTRLEPSWKYFVNPIQYALKLGITELTERMHQSTSWGLVQIMGGVARELGYEGHLTKLIDPKLNIQYGILKLEQLKKKYKSQKDIVSSYNQGSPRIDIKTGLYLNQHYVDSVFASLERLLNH